MFGMSPLDLIALDLELPLKVGCSKHSLQTVHILCGYVHMSSIVLAIKGSRDCAGSQGAVTHTYI